MKRKMCGLLVLTCMMFVLSGCRMYIDYVVNSDDTVTSTSTIAYSQEEIAEMQATEGMTVDMSQLTLKTLEDGKQYYVGPEEKETTTLENANQDGALLTQDILFYPLDAGQGTTNDDLSAAIEYLQMSVTLGADIVDSNANVMTEGKKAVFSTDGPANYWYAYTQKGKDLVLADKKAPTMKGAKNNRYYKKMPTNITFRDNIFVKKVMLNGKAVSPIKSSYTVNGKTTSSTAWYADGKSAFKRGKNIFKVTDIADNTATYIIYVDTQTPTVKGVKNNKTYKNKATVYIKDNLKLSKITINGKNQKMTNKQLVKKGKYKGYYKYTVKKKGSNKIVVKDAAGNKKTLKINIQ